MDLSTFSAVLEFAVKGEQATVASCEKIRAGADPKARETALRLAPEAERNLRQLSTILRENVTELVMEPFEPLAEADYAAAVGIVETAPALRAQIERQCVFLRDAARVVNLREVRRALEKLAGRKQNIFEEE